MRSTFLRALVVLAILPAPALAQRPSTYQLLTVDNTARAIDAATTLGMNTCVALLETAEIRWRNDGVAPTTSVGTVMVVGTAIGFSNINDARSAQFIRTSGTSGKLHVSCFPSNGEVTVTGSGGSGAAGGGGDGAIVDGAAPTVKATVFDGTNSNPIGVALMSSVTGDPLAFSATPTTDPDDASIAAAQTNSNVNALSMIFDGTVWRRLTFGTAGTASAQVLTVQGITNGTPLSVTDPSTSRLISSATNIAAGSALATTSFVTGGRYKSTQDTLTNGQEASWAMSPRAALMITNSVEGLIAGGSGIDASGYHPNPMVDADTGIGNQYVPTVNLVSRGDGGGVELGTPENPIVVQGQTFNLDSVNGAPISMTNPLWFRPTNGSQPMTLSEDASVGEDVLPDGPQIMGGAVAYGNAPTTVLAGKAQRAITDRAGVAQMIGGHPDVFTREAQIEDADGALSNIKIVTVSAGTLIVLTMVAVHCDASTTGPTNIIVGFGTSTIPARAHTGVAGIIAAFDGVPPGGGMVKGSGAGIIAIGASDEDVLLTSEDPVGGACSVEVTGYTIAS